MSVVMCRAVPLLPCIPSWYAENRKGQNPTNLFNFIGLTSKPRMYVSHCNCNTFFKNKRTCIITSICRVTVLVSNSIINAYAYNLSAVY